MMVMKIEMRIF